MVLATQPRMVHQYLVERVRGVHDARRAAFEGVESLQDLAAWQAQAGVAVNKAFGELPAKTPLNARCTGKLKGDGYVIEKLVFESRPGCLVTANLYLPAVIEGKIPGVVMPCGHSATGKAEGVYQQTCARLAREGFAALIYDPYNQGERDQYAGLTDREPISNCCIAHNQMTKQLELAGEWFGMWRAWDGVRALDLLEARPEVDGSRIGLTGNSGGGTMTCWLWALEPRFYMAAPSCFITTFLRNLENEMPQDGEQYPPGLLAAGFELTDMLMARAPKPLLLLGQEYDFFDPRGFDEVHGDLAKAYALHGASDRLARFADSCGHGYSAGNQVAMTRFFCEQVGLTPSDRLEVDPVVLPVEDLLATETGEVIEAGSVPIWSFIGERAAAAVAQRPKLEGPALKSALTTVLGLNSLSVPEELDYRVPRAQSVAGLSVGRYAVETEPGIECVIHHPVKDPKHSFLLHVGSVVQVHVPHLSSEDDLGREAWLRPAIKLDQLYVVQPRGMGESAPFIHQYESFWDSYGQDYMYHGIHLMLGDSYLGRRVHDVRCALSLLRSLGATEVHLSGMGQGALITLLVASLEDDLSQVKLVGLPGSLEEWACAPITTWPSANMVRGMLAVADLPELMASVDCPVEVVSRWNTRMLPVH